jgi:hypothetical protein
VTAIVKDFIAETFVGTVNELETLAPAKLSKAWNDDVPASCDSLLEITIAIFTPYQARATNGPIRARILDPPKPLTTCFAINAVPSVLIIAFLFDWIEVFKAFKPP